VIQPSLVIVYFGGNDSTHPHPSGHGPHVPLSEFIENMRKIGEHLLVKFVTFFFLLLPSSVLLSSWYLLVSPFLPEPFG